MWSQVQLQTRSSELTSRSRSGSTSRVSTSKVVWRCPLRLPERKREERTQCTSLFSPQFPVLTCDTGLWGSLKNWVREREKCVCVRLCVYKRISRSSHSKLLPSHQAVPFSWSSMFPLPPLILLSGCCRSSNDDLDSVCSPLGWFVSAEVWLQLLNWTSPCYVISSCPILHTPAKCNAAWAVCVWPRLGYMGVKYHAGRSRVFGATSPPSEAHVVM